MQAQNVFVQLLAQDVTAEEIAAEAGMRWRNLYAALAPIIGRRGIVAIYKYAVNEVRNEYPSFAIKVGEENDFDDFMSLEAALANQTSLLAEAINFALHQSFNKLLASLIGAPLTERLLQSIADDPDDYLCHTLPPSRKLPSENYLRG